MSDTPTPTPADVVAPTAPTEPAAAAPSAPPATEQKKSLEDLLSGLDDSARATVLAEVTKARGEAANYRTKLRDLEPKAAEWDRLAEASKSELERAQEAASNSEKRAAALVDRAVRAEIKAMAADGFADPEDAAAFLDLSKYAKDGDIDTSAIKADLGDLLARKPHLGKTPISRPPAPNPAQGAGEASASALIAAAEASGDSATSIRLKNQQLLALK